MYCYFILHKLINIYLFIFSTDLQGELFEKLPGYKGIKDLDDDHFILDLGDKSTYKLFYQDGKFTMRRIMEAAQNELAAQIEHTKNAIQKVLMMIHIDPTNIAKNLLQICNLALFH